MYSVVVEVQTRTDAGRRDAELDSQFDQTLLKCPVRQGSIKSLESAADDMVLCPYHQRTMSAVFRVVVHSRINDKTLRIRPHWI